MKKFLFNRFSGSALGLLLSAQVLGAEDLVVLRLQPSAQVDGEGVFLQSILESKLDGPRLRLCDSPAFGQNLVLSRARIFELARVAGAEQVSTNWEGAVSVRISRRSRKLAEDEVLRMLTATLQDQSVKDRGELELRFSRPWTAASVPDEELKIKIQDLPIQGLTPTSLLRFELQTRAGERLGPWQAVLQAHVWREVWVARSALARGRPLHESELTRERRDILMCREAPAEFELGQMDLEINEPVAAGTPLLMRSVKARPLVHRGQSVAAVIQDGALAISLKVEVLEDGAAGQVIRVRNPISRRDLHGKVLDTGRILVCL
jgi:flagellar basal body P-ring formation protein FlgA